MAWKVPGICPDAALYIQLGKAFEAGRLEEALGNIRFNIYPLLLASLHAYGIDWETAGVAWSVLISSCTVLPLYAWIRRAIDRRTALGAGLLYAVHPGLVRWSVEIIRDSTFWFLLAASIYLLWRAVSELRWRWFAAAGVTIALSCLTRFEGLTLFLLLAAWSLRRSKQAAWSRDQAAGGRRSSASCSPLQAPCCKLLSGGLICLGMYPLTLTAVNHLWYHGQIAGLVRTQPAALARDWVQESFKGRSEVKQRANPDLLPRLPAWKMAGRYVTGFFKGLSPLYLLTLVFGVAATRKTILRRGDYWALACVAGPVLVGIWVHLYWSHEAGPRYFFPIVLLTAPLASRGLRRLSLSVSASARRLRSVRTLHGHRSGFGLLLNRRLPTAGALALPALILVVNMDIAFSGDMRSRAAVMEVGQWLRHRYGPSPRLLGPDGLTQVVAHYANGSCRSFPATATSAAIVRQIHRWRPVVVLLDADGPAPQRNEIARQIANLGFQASNGTRLLRTDRWILVMTRDEALDQPAPVAKAEDGKLRIANCKLQI